MKFDHVAINVANIDRAIKWYINALGGEIIYQDETWGLIQRDDLRIAFTIKSQHPPHICFEIDRATKITMEAKGHVFKKHRDGSSSTYVKDLDGNYLEYLIWPRSKKIGENLKNFAQNQFSKLKQRTNIVKKLL